MVKLRIKGTETPDANAQVEKMDVIMYVKKATNKTFRMFCL